MSSNDYIPQPNRVEVSQGSLDKLRVAVSSERGQLRVTREHLVRERQLSQRALEETLKARKERDSYRAVLAAALKGEIMASERKTELEIKLSESEASLNEFVAETGHMKGRLNEIGSHYQAESKARAAEVVTLNAELTTQRAKFEREISAALHELGEGQLERGRAEGRLRELDRQREQRDRFIGGLLSVRAIGLFGSATLVCISAIAFLPPLFRAMFSSTTDEQMLLAVGMTGWGLFKLEFLLLAMALTLFWFGKRDLKRSLGRR